MTSYLDDINGQKSKKSTVFVTELAFVVPQYKLSLMVFFSWDRIFFCVHKNFKWNVKLK